MQIVGQSTAAHELRDQEYATGGRLDAIVEFDLKKVFRETDRE